MNIDELEKLAREATPGPWKYDWGNWEVEKSYPDRNPVCLLNNMGEDDFPRLSDGPTDGTYIAAANPQTVLKLIAVVRAAGEISECPYVVDQATVPKSGDLTTSVGSISCGVMRRRKLKQALAALELEEK